MKKRIIIYQILTRLFGNRNTTCKNWGRLEDNGVGKMNDIQNAQLRRMKQLGITYVWYTGVIRHATCTDYSRFGIPRQHPEVVKGIAGSPYSITDYYDIDPDLAVSVPDRMKEFEELVARTHMNGLKVIIDFVPNHVAREYKSICHPAGVVDLGQDDDTGKHFDPQNNFYYCPGESLDLSAVNTSLAKEFGLPPYVETPAKCTGNDRFDSHPQQNDWYETVKLNYGVDYTDAGGRSYHYDPVPDTWKKMTDILLFWASKGIDGFRCDMAEMVPHEFWKYATDKVKELYPDIIFIGEVYDTAQYRMYIASGFDYLYDKVGMYDCLRGVTCHQRPASAITREWQLTDDIGGHMLYFLENHDEQRIGSYYFAGDGFKGIPALIVAALLKQNPIMIYAGQEFGEKGMDQEGFSGCDGRTTIFDYWTVGSIYHGYWDRAHLTPEEHMLETIYQKILRLAGNEKAVYAGQTFDLMYVNGYSDHFSPHAQYAFMRKCDEDVLFVVVNFNDTEAQCQVLIPEHAFDFLHLPEKSVEAIDLLTGETQRLDLKKNGLLPADVAPYSGRIYKFKIMKAANEYVLNVHNKEEFPPAHTAEHLLNQLMHRMFGCSRSNNAHIERKKSKISYVLDHKPSRREEKAIEDEMNRLIQLDMPVTYEFVNRHNVPEGVDVNRLPEDVGDTIRLVRIGDYDVCPCLGKHVRSTAQIGRFVLLGTNWDEETHSFRIRYKVVQ